MSACEKCWADAAPNRFDGGGPSYSDLIDSRDGVTEPLCTPEEQAGPDATECLECWRWTRHQYSRECMNPGHADRGTKG
jgi:hypothetical protein